LNHVDEHSPLFVTRPRQEALVTHRGLTSAIAVTLALLCHGGSVLAGQFVFLKSAQNDTAQASKDDLKDIFTGRQAAWKNGQKAEIGLGAAGSPELKWVAQELIGASEDILMAKIKQEVFKGEMKKPATVSSAQECIALVKKSPGGICVVDADSAKSLPDGVAILHTAGK
jgi:ABC-type phosphate transport system substrate-binding protein